MGQIVLVAESGADIPKELAEKYGIHIVPMHISFGDLSRPDGSFEPEEIISFYEQTGILPKTSCSTPLDFEKVFDDIHAQNPDAEILYLAYSSVTTCSFQNARLAAEGRDYVTSVDTKFAAAGQGAIVLKMAQMLQEHPQWDIKQASGFAALLIRKARMCFLPSNLEFLRAGGRLSNVAALCGAILSIHPLIEIQDGRLVATKKYRGSMNKIIPRLIAEYADKNELDKEELWLMKSPGLSEENIQIAARMARDQGFQKIHWFRTGGVITCHGGPGAFGIVGFSDNDS